MRSISIPALIALLLGLVGVTQSRLAGECAMLCNDLRTEVLTLEMCRCVHPPQTLSSALSPPCRGYCFVCPLLPVLLSASLSPLDSFPFGLFNLRLIREACLLTSPFPPRALSLHYLSRTAKKTLPRPKVGEFCSNAMEQGFSDACVALCTEQKPSSRVAQACRAAAIEMPRPTVRRWCEHGYNVAFTKTVKDLGSYFSTSSPAAAEEVPSTPAAVNERAGEIVGDKVPPVYSNSESDSRPIVATVPVTLDDSVTRELVVHEGENAEEAVVLFCRNNVVDDEVASCIRQLLTVVLDKLSSN